jgi:hypothetical protein
MLSCVFGKLGYLAFGGVYARGGEDNLAYWVALVYGEDEVDEGFIFDV